MQGDLSPGAPRARTDGDRGCLRGLSGGPVGLKRPRNRARDHVEGGDLQPGEWGDIERARLSPRGFASSVQH